MQAASGSRTLGARTAALAAGAAFLASMIYAGYCYVVRFDAATGPWTIAGGLVPASVDAALFSAFALHHSLLLRAGLKQRIAALVGPRLDRALYVAVASVLFVLVCAVWQPVPGVLWSAAPPWHLLLAGLQLTGVALTVRAAATIGFLDLAGLRQAWTHAPRAPAGLSTAGAYGLVRHPIYFAWLLMVWPAPTMSATRFVFAATSTLYLIVAVRFEERDLLRTFGPEYVAYRQRVRWRLLPYVF